MDRIKLADFTEDNCKTFYDWMQDEELLQLTSTDKMTLAQVLELLEQSQMGQCIVKLILLDGIPIGDIDLFYVLDEDLLKAGEINIMIAEKTYRGKGYGKEALLIFINEISNQNVNLKLDYLCAKIHIENPQSIKLFESVGFVKECDVPNVFKEFKLIYKLTDLNGVASRAGSMVS